MKTLTGKLLSREVLLDFLFIFAALACVNYIAGRFMQDPVFDMVASYLVALVVSIFGLSRLKNHWTIDYLPSGISRFNSRRQDMLNFILYFAVLYGGYFVDVLVGDPGNVPVFMPFLLAVGLLFLGKLLAMIKRREEPQVTPSPKDGDEPARR